MKVQTYSGNIVDSKKCRKIKGVYYQKNVDCFKMNDGKWHRVNNGLTIEVTDDLINYKHILKSEVKHNYTSVVVGINNSYDLIINYVKNNLIEISPNHEYYSVILKNSNEHIVISLEVLRKIAIYIPRYGKYLTIEFILNKCNKYNLIRNVFNLNDINSKMSYLTSICEDKIDLRLNHPYFSNESDKIIGLGGGALQYNIENYNLKESDRYIIPEHVLITILNKEDEVISKMLGKTTFGIEIESSSGKIPADVLKRSSFVPLRDGSISGYEFTSDVLSGRQGVASIKDISQFLKTYLDSTNNESFHVHIKGGSISEKFVTLAYELMCHLEAEVFEMFPEYIKSTGIYKSSGKDYNKKLVQIPKVNFKTIYESYLGGESDYKNHFTGFEKTASPHPLDSSNNRKWNISKRYHWCNFIPTLFKKSGTIEFRLHPNTFDYTKIMYWILIVNAIIKYVYLLMDNDTYNKKPSINEIILAIYNNIEYVNVVTKLTSYVNNRKDFYKLSKKSYKKSLNSFLLKDDIDIQSIENFCIKLGSDLQVIETGKYEVENDSIDAFI